MEIFWIDGAPSGRLATANRPRGDDWLIQDRRFDLQVAHTKAGTCAGDRESFENLRQEHSLVTDSLQVDRYKLGMCGPLSGGVQMEDLDEKGRDLEGNLERGLSIRMEDPHRAIGFNLEVELVGIIEE